MKKILFIGSITACGGKERRLCELIRYLKTTNQYDLWLMVIDDKNSGTTTYDCGLDESRIIKINRNTSRWQTYKQIGRYLKELKPDIVHDWIGARINFYLNPRLPFKKFYFISGFIADGNKCSTVDSILNAVAYRYADCVVSNSRAGILAQKAPQKKSKVIYNGFNLDRLNKHTDAQNLRGELGVADKHIVPMVARLTDAKNHKMFLDIAAKVQPLRHDIVFLIVGKGDNEEALKEYARNIGLKNVMFLGYRTDVEEILKISDISILCSNDKVHAEGVSNSIMESMACSTPVIATDGGGTPEIIEDGKNGFIVAPDDVQSAVGKLLYLIDNEDKRREMAIECRKTIENKFSIEKMTADYIDLYNCANK